jgi:protein-disulfide isomerase
MSLPLWTTRRDFMGALGATAVTAAVAADFVASIGSAMAQATVPVSDLMAANALPDSWLGSDKAPVTIIEYASMTCPHCAHFHAETFPVLKSKYIDTGKVRFTLREFPFDPLAVAGFMLARCAGDKREAMIDLLFAQQKNWAFTDKPLQGLTAVVKQTGMSQQAFDACLQDKALYDNINQVRDRGAQKFGVDATPTFFFNGTKVSGDLSPEELDKQLAPLLKS